MPKQLSDKDRILAFAFRASVPELEEAAAVINAALRAKRGSKPPRTPSKPRGLPGVKNANASDGPDAV